LKCPACGAPTEVRDTRVKRTNTITRRRLCFNMHAFNTLESVISQPKVKRDNKSRKEAHGSGG